MRIWAKLMTNDKIQKDIIFKDDSSLKYDNYQCWVRDICNLLDVPTPVIIPYHYKNFALFHNTRFKQDDFIQSLGYDYLILEDCKD